MKSALIFAVGLATGTACASGVELTARPVTGQVIDSHLRPVPGAFIAAKWIGTFDSLSETSTRCVKAMAVRADEDGNFIVPAWGKPYVGLHNLFLVMVAYKPGLTKDRTAAIVKGSGVKSQLTGPGYIEIGPATVVVGMNAFDGSVEQRRQSLADFISATSCEESDSGMEPLYRAIYQELRAMPPEVAVPGQATVLELAASMLHETSSRDQQTQRDRK